MEDSVSLDLQEYILHCTDSNGRVILTNYISEQEHIFQTKNQQYGIETYHIPKLINLDSLREQVEKASQTKFVYTSSRTLLGSWILKKN